MSSREPLWFCHECHAEMRPIMVPDPVCASCRGSFVEKMEDPADDPREFAHPGHGDLDAEGMPPGMDTFLLSLQTLVDRGIAEGRRQSPRAGSDIGTPGNRVTFQIRTGSSQRPNAGVRPGSGGAEQPLTMDEFLRRESDHAGSGGSTNTRPSMAQGVRSGSGGAEQPLTMDEFLRREPQHTGGGTTFTGPFMAQYLMALLGQRDPLNDFFGRGMGDPAMEGRMGDYVFNQEALDQIITQLMDNSNAYRPVPATEEIISNLPREVLEHDSPMLEKDCAVCKDQFKLETDDPDEQVVVTLPCKHAFHEPCILPWLKSSDTLLYHNQSTTLQQIRVLIPAHIVIVHQAHPLEVEISPHAEMTAKVTLASYNLSLEGSSAVDELTRRRHHHDTPVRTQIRLRNRRTEETDIFPVAGVKISIDIYGPSEH
ncbi:hypothetical protein D9615_001229 [Tricholomella constricta]|uniref:RING-type domain-containing protein n=1 Tax=Tricholomella constricta TaxID=117010 RepID=A0A8H5HLJ1_9AGAR|nr:hypothetical protein D9615_001229 [Tricholomella constricta]